MLTQSGGFAGLHLVVEVDRLGRLTAEDPRSGRKAMQTLSPDELARLEELLRSADFTSPGRLSSGCADCFVYELDIALGSQRLSLRADDTTLAGSASEELIRYLIQLRDEALRSSG